MIKKIEIGKWYLYKNDRTNQTQIEYITDVDSNNYYYDFYKDECKVSSQCNKNIDLRLYAEIPEHLALLWIAYG